MFGSGGQVWLAILWLLPWIACGQSSAGNAAAAPQLPADPVRFLEFAAKVNGLASDEAGPWHVRATFQIFDKEGKAGESGTYEAYWKSPNKYKMNYSSPSYTRIIWANESGSYATSNPKWPGDLEWMIRRSLFDLTPEPSTFKGWNLSWREASIGVRVNCVDALPVHFQLRPREIPVNCFDFGTPILRYGSEARQRYQGVFNNIVNLGGAYVAKDVQLMHIGKTYFRLHLDVLEPLPEVGDEVFRPDQKAVPVPRRVVIDSDLREIQAAYTVGISRWNIEPRTPVSNTGQIADRIMPSLNGQEVILQVLVNKKGTVVEARPIQGEMRAQFKAIAAAMQWKFMPYVVQGEPTEFYTELEFW